LPTSVLASAIANAAILSQSSAGTAAPGTAAAAVAAVASAFDSPVKRKPSPSPSKKATRASPKNKISPKKETSPTKGRATTAGSQAAAMISPKKLTKDFVPFGELGSPGSGGSGSGSGSGSAPASDESPGRKITAFFNKQGSSKALTGAKEVG
jgi:hypothetical protein